MEKPASADLSARTSRAMRDVLEGRPRRWSGLLFAGPAVIASIAYMDPGNFATNIQAGAAFGYDLLWVVVLANAVAMLFQALSAKLGVATGRNLAELCRERLSPRVVLGIWMVSEVAAMATDLAEFVGAATGFSLLLHLPLMASMALTAFVTLALLSLQRRGFRPIELAIAGLVIVISLCYLLEMVVAPIEWRQVAYHAAVPGLMNGAALTIAVGIVGATVMPHALYLHSGLMQGRVPARTEGERRHLIQFSNREVAVALTLAGLVNMAMVVTASAAFHSGHSDVAEIGTAYHALTPLLGAGAAMVFLLSLIASGISSSAVGTMAGQMIMEGFTRRRFPLAVRRLVTMVPAFVVVALGADPTRALVLSQVVLSFALPVPLVALVVFTRSPEVMGPFANHRLTDAAAIAGTAVVLLLNAVLLLQTLGVTVPGLG